MIPMSVLGRLAKHGGDRAATRNLKAQTGLYLERPASIIRLVQERSALAQEGSLQRQMRRYGLGIAGSVLALCPAPT